MKAQYLYMGLIIISLGIIGACGYYWLGGFEEVEVFEMAGDTRLVAGRQFSGRQTNELRDQYFSESRKLIQDSVFTGILTVVNYTHDTLAGNELSQFIGFVLPDSTMGEIPMGYEVREFRTETRLVIFLGMHWFVKPGPNKVERLIRNRANALGLTLDDFFFEIYYWDDSMSVEGWVM